MVAVGNTNRDERVFHPGSWVEPGWKVFSAFIWVVSPKFPLSSPTLPQTPPPARSRYRAVVAARRRRPGARRPRAVAARRRRPSPCRRGPPCRGAAKEKTPRCPALKSAVILCGLAASPPPGLLLGIGRGLRPAASSPASPCPSPASAASPPGLLPCLAVPLPCLEVLPPTPPFNFA